MEIHDSERLSEYYGHARMLGIALVSSLPLYVVVGEVIAVSWDDFNGMVTGISTELLRSIAAVLGLLMLFSANMVRRRLLVGELSLAARVTQAMVPQERYASLLRGTVLSLALCDSLGIIGLGLFLLGGQRFDLYVFASAGLIAAWFYFPRYNQWQHWYAQRCRVR